MNSISLSELSGRIQEAIRMNFDSLVWVRAEISECRENQNGHCYLEFIEKDEYSENIIAKSKAVIWSSSYRMIKPYFEGSTGQRLTQGMKVLVAVSVDYNGLYGFNLVVRDIDPNFTIGETAAQRLKIIRQLEADGIIDMNKQLELPTLIQRIAIISSPTAAGFDDFMDQLQNNQENFVFYPHLFPAIMQGDQAEESIISALDKIYASVDLFDVVVIIRGGGAVTDLACFDSYNLAVNCAQFPLPIIAGIGHQRDKSIVDLVANISLKTPTAVAEFIIQNQSDLKNDLYGVVGEIVNKLKYKVQTEKQLINNFQWNFKAKVRSKFNASELLAERQKNRLQNSVRNQLAKQKYKLQLSEKTITMQSPSYLLKHGYTITTINGKRITDSTKIKSGDQVKTILHDGEFESVVK